ncbi:MAG: UDP-N-acetylglucosamine 2-epimerase (non-hydrolyzing) [Phenylobacterium sp.]|uniref:non-hydrolyzing UDP-N-acetylglucosamine 2-epimerase n=1 Tax=Phenylobacterium sp. TaxID=1871053 RepID=UPI0025E89662|nr:UDP-N-acetylglucosamine 2-epimerase (non-hydrolyzing) [Phenylobacterium sp.]MBI1199550.1 UDP-N-acetylglucosamine 2-epimerase (non-hydrolyzing) [Phenylobacterium sp.]
MKILSVFGTRPEVIKMAPVLRALAREPGVESVACATGQHRELLDQTAAELGVRPDIDLALMRPDQTLNGVTAAAIEALDAVMARVEPDRVLVHGDTTTAMAAAVAAFHRHIPVGHVEAGLRTGDLDQPFPEEFNRRVVDMAANLLWAPTEEAADNLRAERLAGRILVTGNTVLDALELAGERLAADPAPGAELARALPGLDPAKRLVLVTAHRRENFGDGLDEICAALIQLASRPDVEVVYPVHLNPHVRAQVMGRLRGLDQIRLIEPLGYLAFVALMRRAALVLTDSGGVQEEAPALGRPVLVMRDATERPEALRAGAARLVGARAEVIVREAGRLLDGEVHAVAAPNLYGDGAAAERIVDSIMGRPVKPFVAAQASTLAA